MKEQLFDIILKRSFQEGKFVLASGQKSNYYFDLKNTILDPLGSFAIGKVINQYIKNKDFWFPKAVGGTGLGALPVAMAVSSAALKKGRFITTFMVRKESKDHGTKGKVEGLKFITPPSNILIVDDVVSTGASAQIAIDAVHELGYYVKNVVAVVDRNMGGRELFQQQNINYHCIFSMDDFTDYIK